MGSERVVKLQWSRWRWVGQNATTFLNMLRVSGHSDRAVRDMLDGCPLCYSSTAVFQEMCADLGQLAGDIEAEMDWRAVRFVGTGSAVVGFSQNPLKGAADRPSWMCDVLEAGCGICIQGVGVEGWVAKCKLEGKSYPETEAVATCSRHARCTRFVVADLSDICAAVAAFHRRWLARLPGGLKVALSETAPVPEWEVVFCPERSLELPGLPRVVLADIPVVAAPAQVSCGCSQALS